MRLKGLIVVDYQIDKVTGKLENLFSKEIEWSIVSKIRDYSENDFLIYYTQDEHPTEYSKCSESKIINTAHCIRNTEGVDIYGKVRVYLKELGVQCPKSYFGSTSLIRKLRGQDTKLIETTNMGIGQIEIVGCFLEYDVFTIAIMCKSALPECKIIVNSRLSPYLDETKAKVALISMKNIGIDFIS